MVRLLLALVCACLLLTARPADAHPHIWIDVVASFLFENDKVAALRLQWTFDEFFSSGVVDEFDKNKNGKFDTDEIAPLKDGAFDGVKEGEYFTFIYFGDDRYKFEDVSDFDARIEKNRVVYTFTVRFPEPIDPRTTPVSLSAYDESYFIDLGFAEKDPIRVVGTDRKECSAEIYEDRLNPIYYGMVFPKKAELKCGK